MEETMKYILRIGVSVLAMTVAANLANAQSNEQKSGDTQAPSSVAPKLGTKEPSANQAGTTMERGEKPKQADGDKRGTQVEKSTPVEPKQRDAGTDAQKPDAGKSQIPTEKQGEKSAASPDRSDGGSKTKVDVTVTPEQKTRVRDVVRSDSGIKRTNRSQITFNLNVGTRIPETIVFYDAPPTLVTIIPDYRRYKVIVLDDVVLIVDPVTREIVDVIAI